MNEEDFNKTMERASKAVAAFAETVAETVVEGAKAAANTTKTATENVRNAAENAFKETKTDVYLQYQYQECSIEQIKKMCKESYIADGHSAADIKSLKIYLKPEEKAAYYVANDQYLGKVDIW